MKEIATPCRGLNDVNDNVVASPTLFRKEHWVIAVFTLWKGRNAAI